MAYVQFPAHRIGVIVGLDLVGDALIKLPFLRALRAAYPVAEIHWITAQGPTAYNSLLRNIVQPQLLSAVHEMPRWLNSKTSNMPPPDFDLLIDTRNRWQKALAARRHLPNRLFLAPAWHYAFSYRRPRLDTPKKLHMVDRLLQLVELSAGYVPPSTGRLPISPVLMAQARRILPQGNRYIGFAPGAGNPIKIWPLERFIELANQQANKGSVPVFLLGPNEAGWESQLRTLVATAVFPLQEKALWGDAQLSIEHTMAVGSCMELAVANDSGTGHMLAAVDCPLISLFGPTSPEKLAPRVSHGLVIKAQNYGGELMEYIPTKEVGNSIDNFTLAQK